jgi:hypothetical protein
VTSPRDSLLKEVASLVRRYPSRDWFRLATMLEDERTRSRFVSLLKGLGNLADSSVGRKKRKAGTAPSKPPVRRSDVDSRELFELELSRSSIARLRHIAQGYGLQFSPKDSRERLRKMISDAAQRGDIKLGSGPEAKPRRAQGDYAKWAEIIIKGGRPGR